MAYKNRPRQLPADERRLRQARRERRQARQASPAASDSLPSLLWQLLAPALRDTGKGVLFLLRLKLVLYTSRRFRRAWSQFSRTRRSGGADDPAEVQRFAEEFMAVLKDRRLVQPK